MTRFFRICLGFQDVSAFFIIQDFEGSDMYTKYRLGSGFLTFQKCDGVARLPAGKARQEVAWNCAFWISFRRRGRMPAFVRCACAEWRGNVAPHS